MIEFITGTKEELHVAADQEAHLLELALTHWLIFLDFDGVLNHGEFFNQKHQCGNDESFDKECVARLNKLISVMDAVVVISSSWRQDRTLKELREILEAHGFVGTIISKTPEYVLDQDQFSKRRYGQRGDEIRFWLNALPKKIDRFIVLDDNDGMDAVRAHFVQTDFHGGGLTDEKVEEALSRFYHLARKIRGE